MRIAGVDPSLSNFGLAKGTYQDGKFRLTHLHLEETKADTKNKKQVRVNSDDLRRATALANATKKFLSDVDLFFVEVPVGSQTARAMTSYGVCIGILASLEVPMIQVTPTEVKLAATGNKNATKADMIQWAVNTVPDGDWLYQTRKGKRELVNKNEHLADALAAIAAGLTSDTFSQLMSFQRKRP